MQLFTLTASLHCKNLGHLFFPTLFQFGGETDVTNQTTASGNCSLLAAAFTAPLFQLRPVFSSVFLLDEWSCTLRTCGWCLLSYSPSFPFVANVSQCGSVDSRSLRKSFIILRTLIQTSPLEFLLNVLQQLYVYVNVQFHEHLPEQGWL